MSVAGTRTIPWSWYVDPAALQMEQERIFRRFWQYVARTDEIPEPGSFHTTRVGNVPVLLVRDHDDVLRAFVNVCRHRGSIVCKGSGTRETLQCPYHAWTYGLDGRLLAAPRADREGGIEQDDLGLVQLQLETWGPFVFVNPDPDAPVVRHHKGRQKDRLGRPVRAARRPEMFRFGVRAELLAREAYARRRLNGKEVP